MLLEEDVEDGVIGTLIKQGREIRHLTQEALAEQVGVEPRTIQRWEAEASLPWPECLGRLTACLPEVASRLVALIKKNQL